MSLLAAADVPLVIKSSNSSSERRISPSWTIAHFKTRLETITGVPVGSQQLTLRVGSQDAIAIAAIDEEQVQLAAFPLQPYAEITVSLQMYSPAEPMYRAGPCEATIVILSWAATSLRQNSLGLSVSSHQPRRVQCSTCCSIRALLFLFSPLL
jgi:hypothetical protein